MSLNYDLSRIANSNDVCWITADQDIPENGMVAGKQYLSSVTQALIFRTMAVGIGSLTEKTIVEFCTRNEMWCRLHGYDNDLPMPILKAHLGLSTNVPYESKAKWMKRIVDAQYQELMYTFAR